MKKYFVSNFYKPQFDQPSPQEDFLLKRRMRLMARIRKVDLRSKWGAENLRKLKKQLRDTEQKLGVK